VFSACVFCVRVGVGVCVRARFVVLHAHKHANWRIPWAEPKHNFLSTLESISYCISVLEDESRGSPPERDTPPLSSATTHAFEAPTNGGGGSEGEEEVSCRTASEWLIHAFKKMVATQVSFIPNQESIEGRFGGSSRGNHRELAKETKQNQPSGEALSY
jgi:hypothetical protein